MVEGPPKPTLARFAVAENLKRYMVSYRDPKTGDRVLVGKDGQPSSRALAKLAPGVSYKTIDRMLDPYHDSSPNLDSLDVVATFFGIHTFQLLMRIPAIQGTEARLQEAPTAEAGARRKTGGR